MDSILHDLIQTYFNFNDLIKNSSIINSNEGIKL